MTDFTSNFDGVPVGWSFSGNQVQILKSPPFAPSGVDGENYLEMYNTADLGTLSQDVTGLVAGQPYKLSFLWGNRTSAFDITISMGGSSFNESGDGLIAMTIASLIFTATRACTHKVIEQPVGLARPALGREADTRGERTHV
jgi:hypothetical protein